MDTNGNSKELLIKDLCSRLPYELWVQYDGKEYLATGYGHGRVSLLPSVVSSAIGPCPLVEEVRSYLRPMSSMTEEEDKEWQIYKNNIAESCDERLEERISELHDWFNSHHFDFHHLIEKGLALEVKEGMYKVK